MQRRLDRDDVIHLGLQCLKHGIELPSATTALVDDKFDLSLEGPERLEPQVKQDWLIWRRNALSSLVNEYESIDEALVSWVEHIDLEVELVIVAYDIRPWQVNLQGVLERTSGLRSEIVIDRCRSTFSNSAQRILPDKLLAHADNDKGT